MKRTCRRGFEGDGMTPFQTAGCSGGVRLMGIRSLIQEEEQDPCYRLFLHTTVYHHPSGT